MRTDAAAYVNALANGVRPEDARFLLPEACKTEISVKMNLRSFFQFLDLREDMSAQWEIRDLAHSMEQAAIDINDQWKFLINLRRKHET
jgi:thymidylate synthase (FAD)